MGKRDSSTGYLIVLSLLILLISGCSGSSDSGLCRSIGGVFTHSWPSSDINISETGIDWRDAGTMWEAADLTFNYGIPGQIKYGGSISKPNQCGYAEWEETNTTTQSCTIYLNEELISAGQCRERRYVIAHELGHCLGIEGHIFVSEGGNIMSSTGGTYIDESVIESIRKLYATIGNC